VAAAAFDTVFKVVALMDLGRRPTSEVRGSKAVWAVAVTLANSAGTVPITYFIWGRRTRRHSS